MRSHILFNVLTFEWLDCFIQDVFLVSDVIKVIFVHTTCWTISTVDTDGLALTQLRLFSNLVKLHWHNINDNKISTVLKLHHTKASDIVLIFSLATDVSKYFIVWNCLHTHCCCRELRSHALWCHRLESTFSTSVSLGCFNIDIQATWETFLLNRYVYLFHLMNILCMFCDYFP